MKGVFLVGVGGLVGVGIWYATRRDDGEGLNDIEEGFYKMGAADGGLKLEMDTRFDSVRWANLGKAPDALRYDKNVMAVMRVIRSRESSQGPEAYFMLCGHRGAAFSSLLDHPRPTLPKPCTRGAAGAYQITIATWDAVRAATPLIKDFTQVNQERAALQLMAYRGALNNAIRGELRDALSKLKKEWTSLPGGAEELQSYDKARAVFLQYGGKLAPGH